MSIIKRYAGSVNAAWPHNLTFDIDDYENIVEWCKITLGHEDVFKLDDVWLSHKTEEPIVVEVRYFFWGHSFIQFKYEEDMVKFILKFSG